MSTNKVDILYDEETDIWLVFFQHQSKKVATRRYGTLKTLLGALEDFYNEERKEKK